MLTKQVDVQNSPINLHDLLILVQEGNEVILTKGANPLARVIPITSSSTPRKAGLHPGAIQTSEDFDEPLPEEFWVGTP
ncbi:MAG: toxin-antitoxin (TA) system antitoxin [Candidatus Competibacteraceae bacterium]